MVRHLIEWALYNPLVVILVAVAFAVGGIASFLNVNVEAYPDPAPAIVEVFAQYPGASAEEVERQVTLPLEVTFAGMPGLNAIRSKSLYGLSDVKMSWNYGSRYSYEAGRQEVINRLATLSQPLPQGVTAMISPESPTGEIYRYALDSPKDDRGHEIYTLNDLKALQDWVLEREFRTVPGIVDVCGWGGTVRRYEVQPDPDRLRRYGITLAELQAALQNSNSTVGGDYINQGQVAMTVRSVGLFGGGVDPTVKVLGMQSPSRAAQYLRSEEQRRVRDIRKLVIKSVNNQPIRVEDVVEGGRAEPGSLPGKGVVVSHLTRLGRIGYWKADRKRPSRSPLSLAQVGHDEPDVVESIVLMRKNEQTLPTLVGVKKKVAELNEPSAGRMLPGVKIEPYYDRSDLLAITTETVRENLILGMSLVSLILLMFLSNVRTALIVAINIPLALLFAFSALYLRDMSANLLSIGAVDFGIIVDSSVIMVENIYRHLSTGEYADLTLKEQILRATHEVERGLFFTTAIMVCAFLPLFTMQGPEGQIFGPMADTYAFALCGALLLALTLGSRALHVVLQKPSAGLRQLARAPTETRLFEKPGPVPPFPLGDCRNHGSADRRNRPVLAVLGPRIHAGPRGGEHLDPRHGGAEHLARASQRDLDPCAVDHRHLPGGGVDRKPSSAGPMTPPTPTATTTASILFPCGRKRTGRESSKKKAGGNGFSAAYEPVRRMSW